MKLFATPVGSPLAQREQKLCVKNVLYGALIHWHYFKQDLVDLERAPHFCNRGVTMRYFDWSMQYTNQSVYPNDLSG
jgi:hypothetical protein